jgi:hypothetical protein
VHAQRRGRRVQVIFPTTVWIEAARLCIADAADKTEVYRQHGEQTRQRLPGLLCGLNFTAA